MQAPIIYNLFPRLVGPMDRWEAHARRALELGFDWLFVNPILYPGFSGSLYAVKDFYRLNPLFVPPGVDDEMAALQQTLERLRGLGLRVMMDLVINHTAKDSPLTRSHPEWFRRDEHGDPISPSAIDPADARKVTVWGDLAEVDNARSTDRVGLWAYWGAMLRHYQQLGFDGFRCDAAYKVPARLWEQLIGGARRHNPEAVFAAETLGCRLEEVDALAPAGFDFLFNSSKWWNFDEPWCLEQHETLGRIAPSIAFAESHDTPRLMQEVGLQRVVEQRYAFSAFFSAGVMMPLGFEFGFREQVNVVTTQPTDWEQTGVDLGPFIARVNALKRGHPVLGAEGHHEALSGLDLPTLLLRKVDGQHPEVVLLINKDWHQPQRCGLPAGLAGRELVRLSGAKEASVGAEVVLQPAEIALLVTSSEGNAS